MNQKQAIGLLGFEVRDKVTGLTGIAESVCFDLYGCIQVAVRSRVNEKNEIPDGRWFDVKRLDVVGAVPVMPVDSFDGPLGQETGPAEKPVR